MPNFPNFPKAGLHLSYKKKTGSFARFHFCDSSQFEVYVILRQNICVRTPYKWHYKKIAQTRITLCVQWYSDNMFFFQFLTFIVSCMVRVRPFFWIVINESCIVVKKIGYFIQFKMSNTNRIRFRYGMWSGFSVEKLYRNHISSVTVVLK